MTKISDESYPTPPLAPVLVPKQINKKATLLLASKQLEVPSTNVSPAISASTLNCSEDWEAFAHVLGVEEPLCAQKVDELLKP